jgi:hypothetical protein
MEPPKKCRDFDPIYEDLELFNRFKNQEIPKREKIETIE